MIIIVTEKTNAYFRDTIVKVPEDCTFITSNIIGWVWIVGSQVAMGFPGNPKSRKMEGKTNNREIIASFLESRYHKHYRLFNLTEEVYDSLLFDCSVYYDSFA